LWVGVFVFELNACVYVCVKWMGVSIIRGGMEAISWMVQAAGVLVGGGVCV
jgi:hypothetical protein